MAGIPDTLVEGLVKLSIEFVRALIYSGPEPTEPTEPIEHSGQTDSTEQTERTEPTEQNEETKTGWKSLPPELRIMIYETIASQKLPGWASCAAVNKEWQSYIEPANFRRLKLTQLCLGRLARLSERARAQIRHIDFDVLLPRYDCQVCATAMTDPCTIAYGRKVHLSVCRLLFILEQWGKPSAQGLSLNITAYSPSDNEHWFRNIRLAADQNDWDVADGTAQVDRSSHAWHDPRHAWVVGRYGLVSNEVFTQRVTYRLPLAFGGGHMPTVQAVTHFSIRRQLRHRLEYDELVRIVQCFPCLEELVYEPWREWYLAERIATDNFLSSLPSCPSGTIKSLIMFEDFNYAYPGMDMHGDPARLTGPRRLYDPGLGHYLGIYALLYEKMAISYMVDAVDFFAGIQSGRTKLSDPPLRLESLALTTQLFREWDKDELKPISTATVPFATDDQGPLQEEGEDDEASFERAELVRQERARIQENRQMTDQLLVEAARAVWHLRRLHTLAIWHGDRGHANAFIYQGHPTRGATITWRGTYKASAFSPRVLRAWQQVADKFCSQRLEVRYESLAEHRADIVSHGDAIHYLRLPCQVVSKVSLNQIRRETLPKAAQE